jgi:hypothetical protein
MGGKCGTPVTENALVLVLTRGKENRRKHKKTTGFQRKG